MYRYLKGKKMITLINFNMRYKFKHSKFLLWNGWMIVHAKLICISVVSKVEKMDDWLYYGLVNKIK